MSRISILSVVLIAGLSLLLLSQAKPLVDPGLFVIFGVSTCREGLGYCLLGVDCTLDEDFLPDDLNGHCDGLRNAFTPSAHFICCKYDAKNTTRTKVTTTTATTLIEVHYIDEPSEASPALPAAAGIVQDVNIISSSQLELKPELAVTNEIPAVNIPHSESDVSVLMVNAEDLKVDSDVDKVDNVNSNASYSDDSPKPEKAVDILYNNPDDALSSDIQETKISVKTDKNESVISKMPASSDHVVVDDIVEEASVLEAVLVPGKVEEPSQNNDWSPIIYTLADDDKDNIKEIELDVQIPVEAVAAPKLQAREPISVAVITLDSNKPEPGNVIVTEARRIHR